MQSIVLPFQSWKLFRANTYISNGGIEFQAMMVLDKDAAVPEDNNVIQVNTLTSRLQRLNDKVVWILYDFEVISRSEGKIGDPVPFKIDASVLSRYG